ncbi:MAG: hypothetical protein J0L88_01965 [Xanthomonadales bacterium]|nr:hypothetical protein [Xanthomonadales bacterium]
MIFDFPRTYPPDATEIELVDGEAVRACAGERLAEIDAALAARRQRLASLCGPEGSTTLLARVDEAIRIAYARLARRHGSWSTDFHAYHNEGHILEIFGTRIDRLIEARGIHALSLRDWCALGLFAACHDLRQREQPLYAAGVGANERASLEESFRLLRQVGFDEQADADLYLALDLMIDGSTFDARPPPGGAAFNAAELVQSGGALASQLERKLDKHRPGWREDARIRHALDLALIAADLDTANVAEPFAHFAITAANLCREREMLCRRNLDHGESAQPVLGFLTDGQDRFFFDLHRFHSELGRATFERDKAANAERLKSLSLGLRARIAVRGRPESGTQVLKAYGETVAGLL